MNTIIGWIAFIGVVLMVFSFLSAINRRLP